MPKGNDQDGPDMEYLGEMNADFERLEVSGRFELPLESMEELERQMKLHCKPENRLVWGPGMKSNGDRTWWWYFQVRATGEILEGGNAVKQCPPLPLEECA